MQALLDTLTQYEVYHNTALNWLLCLLITIIVYFTLRLALRFAVRRLTLLSEKTRTFFDNVFVSALKAIKPLFVFIIALWLGLRCIDRSGFEMMVDLTLVLALTLQAAFCISRMVNAYITHYAASQREENPGSVSAMQGLSFIAQLAIWSVAILLIVDNFGYDVNALIAGLGIGGIAIALAVQNILSDLFASLSIILDKPFVVGDFVIVGDLMGVVERIGIKTTRVKSLSGEQLIFSNADLLGSRIRNFKRMEERRVVYTFGVVYQTTPDQLGAIPPLLTTIICGQSHVRFDRAHFKNFGESSYDFEVVYYMGTPDYNQYMDTQQAINLAMCREFEKMGIEFAYPTRTIFMNQS